MVLVFSQRRRHHGSEESSPPRLPTLFGGVYSVGGLVLLRRFDREFPFGPALVAGWVVVVALADTLVG